MASYSYGSESTTKISNSSNASSWTGSWTFAAINAIAKANIPANATITKFTFTVYAKEQGGTFNSDIDIFFANSSNSSVKSLYSNDDCVYDSDYSSYALDLKSNVQSGNTSAGQLAYSSADRICVKLEKTTSLGTNRKWQCYYVATWEYTLPTCTITLDPNGGSVSPTTMSITGGNTYGTLPTPTRTGYTFNYWTKDGTRIYSTTTVTSSHTLVANWTINTYTVNFKNTDGTVAKSLSVEYGKALGTLPTVSRNGYTFGGWIPCAPAKKSDGSVLDSYQYDGSTAYPLDKKYKYTDKLSVHIEAYMSDWADIKNLKSQIASCTEGGGWGLGYMANTTGNGSEIYSGGSYRGIDLGFNTPSNFTNKTWYSFDIVFSNGTFEVYLNGTKKGTQTTAASTISYNSDNTIFIGAEAGKTADTPAGNYFEGYISNVFIANQGSRLVAATSGTTVTGNIDYYPIWRKNYTITFKNGDGSTLETVTAEHGKTPKCSKTPTKASTVEYDYTWDTSNPWSPAISTANCDQTYTPNFTATKRKYTVTFKDENGTTLKTESVDYNSNPTPPTNPTKTDTAQWDYTFDGWYDTNGNKWTSDTTITSATTFTARYTAVVQKYTVKWYNEDGSALLETDDDVPYGTIPTYDSTTPTKAETTENTYEHIGWSINVNSLDTTDLSAVVESVNYYARFRAISKGYTIIWKNDDDDGTVLETDTLVPFGTQPDYNGATPTKESDAQYDYTFLGWSAKVEDSPLDDTQLPTVTGNIIYTAVYTKTLKLYPIRIVLFDTEYTSVVEYGDNITFEAPVVTGYKFIKWSDGNTDNPRTVKVVGEATYEAVYEKIPLPIIVNTERVTDVYIVPTTKTIVYVISGEVPTVEVKMDTVDDWNFEVSNSVPDNSHLLEKLYINETRIY